MRLVQAAEQLLRVKLVSPSKVRITQGDIVSKSGREIDYIYMVKEESVVVDHVKMLSYPREEECYF